MTKLQQLNDSLIALIDDYWGAYPQHREDIRGMLNQVLEAIAREDRMRRYRPHLTAQGSWSVLDRKDKQLIRQASLDRLDAFEYARLMSIANPL